VRFAAITLCVASQRVFIVVDDVYFVIYSVRKLLDTLSYVYKFILRMYTTLLLSSIHLSCSFSLLFSMLPFFISFFADVHYNIPRIFC